MNNKHQFGMLTIHNCKWCDKAKELLKEKGLRYQTWNVQDSVEALEKAKENEVRTYPFISIKHYGQEPKVIGGYTELKEYVETNNL